MRLHIEPFATVLQLLALKALGDESGAGSYFAGRRVVDSMSKFEAEEAVVESFGSYRGKGTGCITAAASRGCEPVKRPGSSMALLYVGQSDIAHS